MLESFQQAASGNPIVTIIAGIVLFAIFRAVTKSAENSDQYGSSDLGTSSSRPNGVVSLKKTMPMVDESKDDIATLIILSTPEEYREVVRNKLKSTR